MTKDFSYFLHEVKGLLKVEKSQPDFWKKFWIWRYLRKRLQISPKSDTSIFFSNTALTIFWVFGQKLVLNKTYLNETYFSEKFAIWRYLTSKLSKFGCFLTICCTSQCILVFSIILCTKHKWYLLLIKSKGIITIKYGTIQIQYP